MAITAIPTHQEQAGLIRSGRCTDEAAMRRILVAAKTDGATMIAEFEHPTGGAHRLVAEVGGVVAGTATFVPSGAAAGARWPAEWASIRALAVDPAYRARGLARQLVDACVDRATNAGADAIGLHTADVTQSALRLYEHVGFTRAPAFDQRAAIAYSMDLAPRRNVRRLRARRVLAPARASA